MSPCPSGDSPVYLAVFACIYYNIKKTAAIKVLLASGCSVNVQNNNGFTPLHLAAMYGSFNFTQFLLNEGADPCITNMDGLEPADLALHAGHLKIQKILQETKCMKAHIIK
uniref:Uncharacterized protein n=1 Tax=Eptatretus burgeri TaxID=7764 RepID=A0A8C4WVE6_EPTBU